VNSGYLLDTNVLSELMRQHPNAAVMAFMAIVGLDRLFTSDVTYGELAFGASLLGDIARKQAILDDVNERIRPLFAGRVLSADEDTWLIWKRMERDGRRRRYTFPQPDLVIAALAEQHGFAVVTRDVEPFREAGVMVRNPWEG
jgi:toxin FitB